MILGINTSHDTSVAGVDEQGNVKFCHDEARFRRQKYWDPSQFTQHDNGLFCIERMNLHEPDHVAYASFDRRTLEFQIDKESLVFDRLKAEEFMKDAQAKQLSWTRLEELQQKYPGFVVKEEDDQDFRVIEDINNQINKQDFFFEKEHHLYHAECVHKLSPWYEEECIAIVWDGGGAQCYYDQYPGYQEMETIYHCVPGKEPKKMWQRLSNNRQLVDLGFEWPNHYFDCLWCMEDDVLEIDGIEVVFSSKPSCGNNFSQMSVALGCDEDGRAAGKVMGMASYARLYENVHNQFTVAQQLEVDSLKNSLNIIEKAKELIPNTNKILLSGGYSLNCTNNYKYLETNPDHEFFVDPIPHDGGTAVGVALNKFRRLQNGSN